MGLLDAFRKKSEPALDLPPSPEDTLPQAGNDPFAQPLDLGAPADVPPLAEPQVDMPPAPEEPEVDAPPALESMDEPAPVQEAEPQAPATQEEALTPLEPLEEEPVQEEPKLDVEMPEEIKPKRKKATDSDFAQRLAKVKSKVSAKEQNKKISGEMDQLRTENEYLKARLEKLTSLMEALPISELDSRLEKVHSEHREQRGKISDMLDKLSVHSNLINETISVREDFEKLKSSDKETKKQVDLLSDSLDSYKNTLYMMNKKVELVDHSKRIDQIEGKIKEIIVYLNKITRIITKD